MTAAPPCRLYLITPPRIDAAAFSKVLAEALDAGEVACVQLRLKDVDDDAIRRACDVLRPVAHARDAAFVLNDRPDLATATGCDGVHIGQDDAPYAEARRLIGQGGIVGVTCHDSRHLAMTAAESGADYVAFGAFFPTLTKEPKAQASIETLAWWADLMTVPCVAIGGITTANCRPLIEAGADFIAICAGVWEHPNGPAAAVREFHRIIAEVAAPAS